MRLASNKYCCVRSSKVDKYFHISPHYIAYTTGLDSYRASMCSQEVVVHGAWLACHYQKVSGNPVRPALHPHAVHYGDMDNASIRGRMRVYINTAGTTVHGTFCSCSIVSISFSYASFLLA